MYDINKVRQDFPILSRTVYDKPLVYLDNAATTQKPLCVLDAMRDEYLNVNANVHRGVHYLSQQATDLHEAARETVRKFINAPKIEEIIFTRGTTESLNLVVSSFCDEFMSEGDEVIISTMEHHSNIVPWQLQAAKKGIAIRVIPINDKGEINLDEFTHLFTNRTKIVSIAQVSNVLGTVNPVKEMIKIAHEHDVPVIVDGAQSTPHFAVDVQDLDCDFFAFSGHKIYGPTGIGVLYGKEEWLEKLPPYQGGGEMIESVSFEKTTFEKLPFKFEVVALTSAEMAATAIQDMWVRGAPLIGVVAAYGIALGMNHDASDMGLQRYYDLLIKTRPTAINLKWALDRMIDTLKDLCVSERKDVAWALAAEIAEEDVALCEQIGLHGAEVIREIAQKKPAGSVVNILTHCNAGWLATVDWGTALSPIYKAHENGIPVHVWVDETRPRNQGGLTAFELGSHGIPHTLIADNAGGHLMQHGDVDLCIVGTDRTTARGDVCNKIGTYLKALAAHDNHVPFYVALPSPTIDWTIEDGKSIPIEQRDGKEQSHVYGINPQGELSWVNTAPEGTRCGNYAFDVTPARYITGFITERGVCAASKSALADMFADLKSKALQGEQH